VSDLKTPETNTVFTLKDQLDSAELRLKKLQWWATAIAVFSGIIAVVNISSAIRLSIAQRQLADVQATEQKEKQRISFGIRVIPVLLPDAKHFYLITSLKNFSARHTDIVMLGVRVWKGSKWDDKHDSPSDYPDDILVSDILVANCPNSFCRQENEKKESEKALKLRTFDQGISVETSEPETNQNFGPYNISQQQAKSGIWVEGFAYAQQTEQGECQLNTSKIPEKGDTPSFCEKIGDRILCKPPGSCTSAYSSPEFYKLTSSHDKTVTLRGSRLKEF